MVLIVATAAGALGWSAAHVMAGDTRPPDLDGLGRGVITAPVASRHLQVTVTARADIDASILAEVDVHGRTEGALVTRAPVGPGAAVTSGDPIIELDGRPVFVMSGSVPMYRDLVPGASGADVAQLQESLRADGFAVTDAPGTFGPTTQDAVRRWYEADGYTAVGSPPDLVAASDATRDALAEARAALAEAESALGAARRTPDAAGDVTALVARRDEAARRTERAASADDRAQAALGTRLPQGEVAILQGLPLHVRSTLAVGATAQGAVAVLGGGALQAIATLPPSDAALLAPGQLARLDQLAGADPDGATGEDDHRRAIVARIDPPATDDARTEDAASTSGQRVTLGIDRPTPTMEGTNVRLTIVVRATDGKVLAVPGPAIRTASDGSAFVEVVRDASDTPRRVRVVVGVAADGLVEIRDGQGITTRDRVVVGRSATTEGEGE